MPQIINWEIIANPLNWIIVGLMLAIAVFGLSLVSGGPTTTTMTGSAGL
jgi:hypothetical protein